MKYDFHINLDETNSSHVKLLRRIAPGSRVLELGCATGYLSQILTEKLNCRVVGVDIDAEAATVARMHCEAVIVGDLDQLDLREVLAGRQFDVILCADVVEHLKEPAKVLAQARELLAAPGRLLASIPNFAHASIRLELLQGHFDYEKLGLLDETHLHFYTRDSLVNLLTQAGFASYDIDYTWHDLADEAISAHLAKMGLPATPEALAAFHQPDAMAYQFIVEARPAHPDVLKHRVPPLDPKPLADSQFFYARKAEHIDALEKEIAQLKAHSTHLTQHIEQLQQQIISLANERDAIREHAARVEQQCQAHIANVERDRDESRRHHRLHVEQIEKQTRAHIEAVERERDEWRRHAERVEAQAKAHIENVEREREAMREHVARVEAQAKAHIENVEKQRDEIRRHAQLHAEQIEEQCRVRIETAERERDELRRHAERVEAQAKAHIENVERERDALQVHNDNRQQHINELAERYNGLLRESWEMDELLFQFTLQHPQLQRDVEQLTAEKQHLIAEVHQLRGRIDAMQAVLDRIHDKLPFRVLLALKRLTAKRDKPRAVPMETPVLSAEIDPHDYTRWVQTYDLPEARLQALSDQTEAFADGPVIGVIMPVFNTDAQHLQAAIESIIAQVYPHWRLYLVDDCSTAPHITPLIKRYTAQDARISAIFRECNGHIAEASNSAMQAVTTEYVALMDHDDLLAPDALYWVAKTLHEHPDAQLIYSDEDKINERGERHAPYFKPDWNPDLLLSHNFVCHLAIYRTALIREAGGFRSAFDGAQDYDLVLRITEQLSPRQIVHIPRVLYHWRAIPGSTALGVEQKPYAQVAAQRAVEEALARRGITARVMPHAHLPGALQVRRRLPNRLPHVTLVIPTRNGFMLLKRCIESILHLTDYPEYDILLVDNGSDELVSRRYLQTLARHERITVIRDERPFNYAALNNAAVKQARGELLGLLNNDLEVISPDWLSEMVSHAIRPEVGAVGAKLYYPNDTIQHAGVIVGLGGVAGHSHKHFPRNDPGFCGRLLLTQNLSAVTAACLVLRKSVYEEVGGLDETNLGVAFNDVDFCLRIREKGYWNVWTPYAELYHHESATRGYEDTPEKQARFSREIDYMKQRWGVGLLQDPAYNPNLTLDREDFSLAWPPRVAAG